MCILFFLHIPDKKTFFFTNALKMSLKYSIYLKNHSYMFAIILNKKAFNNVLYFFYNNKKSYAA